MIEARFGFARDPPGEMESISNLPQAHVVTEIVSLPVAVEATGDIENRDCRCPNNDSSVLVAEIAHRPEDTRRVFLFILTVGVLLLAVALGQALLASDIKKNVRNLPFLCVVFLCSITCLPPADILDMAHTWRLKSTPNGLLLYVVGAVYAQYIHPSVVV